MNRTQLLLSYNSISLPLPLFRIRMQVSPSFFPLSPSLADKDVGEAPAGCPMGVPLASLWTWIQRLASPPSVGVHTPTDKKSCPPLLRTWFYVPSPSFLFLDASFQHPCTSLSPSKLLSNKQSVPSYVFPISSHFCCIHTQVWWVFQCCCLGNLDFVWYHLQGCLGTAHFARLCTPKLPYQYPVHTGIISFTIYTH